MAKKERFLVERPQNNSLVKQTSTVLTELHWRELPVCTICAKADSSGHIMQRQERRWVDGELFGINIPSYSKRVDKKLNANYGGYISDNTQNADFYHIISSPSFVDTSIAESGLAYPGQYSTLVPDHCELAGGGQGITGNDSPCATLLGPGPDYFAVEWEYPRVADYKPDLKKLLEEVYFPGNPDKIRLLATVIPGRGIAYMIIDQTDGSGVKQFNLEVDGKPAIFTLYGLTFLDGPNILIGYSTEEEAIAMVKRKYNF